ncbi:MULTISPECIES: hypothetical protein [unclassified Paraflavitalea]|uniref:hypothetical protein n=1 Tax=unclassified Paraflavitalea TaxID=2798305 RepID=UPI003D350B1C
MEASINTLVHHLFKKSSIQDLELSDIEAFVNKYPYANAGRVVLAAKKFYLHPEFQDEVHAAALYLKNPLWLEQLLNEAAEKTSPPTFVENGANTSNLLEEEQAAAKENTEDKSEQELIAAIASEPESNFVISGTIVVEESVDQDIVVENTVVTENEPDASVEISQIAPQEPQNEEPPVVNIHKLPTISAVLPENTVSLIEPYHTIDYFASQGIKVKLEDLDKDKFGRQLKSFTEWLRTMKKIPKVSENVTDEAVVVKQAEESIENTEVETEAMAEVWLKQGKTTRAKAIYRKLSLLNPDKTAYFASKIDQIKD